MKAQKSGKIVTVASYAGSVAGIGGGYAHYGANKAAIAHYTRYLAQELGPFNINCNCARPPGVIETARIVQLVGARAGDNEGNREIALRRNGRPEDCAKVVEFTTTDLSDYVTGSPDPDRRRLEPGRLRERVRMTIQPLISEKTKTSDAVLRVLEDAGIDMVFGGRPHRPAVHGPGAAPEFNPHTDGAQRVAGRRHGRGLWPPDPQAGRDHRPGSLGAGQRLVQGRWALLSSSPMLLLTDFSDNPGFNLHGPYQAGTTGDYGVWNTRQALR